jgi:hypothetical protein
MECILCKDPLTPSNGTDEHVIPNALGASLVTRLATCFRCNSKAGDTIDAQLVKALRPLATQLNVARDRGRHPDVEMRDVESGRRLLLRPGEPPIYDDEPTFASEPLQDDAGRVIGKTVRVTLSAPTEEEARRRVRKLVSSRRSKVEIGKIVGTLQPESTYSYTVSLPMADNSINRAVMKIALCFARSRGFRLRPSAIGCRFLRGEELPFMPFGVPKADVVEVTDFEPMPPHHAICVKRSGSRLLAYVALFSIYECVLLLDEACDDHSDEQTAAYLWDLAVDCVTYAQHRWVMPDDQFQSYLGAMSPDQARLQNRGSTLLNYLQDPANIALTRGTKAAVSEYLRLTDCGATHEAAEAAALTRFKELMEGLGFSIDEIAFSVKPAG